MEVTLKETHRLIFLHPVQSILISVTYKNTSAIKITVVNNSLSLKKGQKCLSRFRLLQAQKTFVLEDDD